MKKKAIYSHADCKDVAVAVAMLRIAVDTNARGPRAREICLHHTKLRASTQLLLMNDEKKMANVMKAA